MICMCYTGVSEGLLISGSMLIQTTYAEETLTVMNVRSDVHCTSEGYLSACIYVCMCAFYMY